MCFRNLLACSIFVCQGTTKWLFRSSSQSATCYYLSNHLGNPVKCFAQGHNKRTCRPNLHTILSSLNVKQEHCEYQNFKSLVWFDEEIKPRSTDHEKKSAPLLPFLTSGPDLGAWPDCWVSVEFRTLKTSKPCAGWLHRKVARFSKYIVLLQVFYLRLPKQGNYIFLSSYIRQWALK